MSGKTSTGIDIPFEEVLADSHDLDQTMLYVVQPDELIIRFHLNLGKQQFKVPQALISNSDQTTWDMAQDITVVPENDCIVERIDIQVPVLMSARNYLKSGKLQEWFKLGVPEVLLKAKTTQFFKFPNGLIAR